MEARAGIPGEVRMRYALPWNAPQNNETWDGRLLLSVPKEAEKCLSL